MGNVWEWTLSLWGEEPNTPEFRYPYSKRRTEREDVNAPDPMLRVVRGGSWFLDGARAVFRDGGSPDARSGDVGFRVVCVSAPIP